MTKSYIRHAVAAAFVATSGASGVAFAEIEREANNSISTAQRLIIGESRRIEITGGLGLLTDGGTPIDDVDFYSFYARANDTVSIDIDFGIKARGTGLRSVDTVLAIYGPGFTGGPRWLDDVDVSAPVDSGSMTRRDARLDNVLLSVSGIYTVGVASTGRTFLPDGTLTAFVPGSSSNGGYTLIIEGVSPSMKPIQIDIKPGNDRITRLNPKSKGKIPVALLSAADFNPLNVDRSSIRFGPQGTEASAVRCGNERKHDDDDDDDDDNKHGNKHGRDVNRDRLPDLVCHFKIQDAGFDESHEEGIVTGTIDGLPFEGRGSLKVLPVKRKHKDDD